MIQFSKTPYIASKIDHWTLKIYCKLRFEN
jgi:hypothetical protein